jgi:O-antigen/teichoic acid export membrane protein
MPFAKTIYRLGYNTIARLSMRLLALGVVIVVPGLVGIYVILVFLYHFPVTPALLVLGGLMVLPVYCYLPIVYGFYKANRQIVVLEINVLGIVASLGLNILLLPRIGMVGAIAASAAAQWLMLALYLVWGKTLRDRYALLVPELS